MQAYVIKKDGKYLSGYRMGKPQWTEEIPWLMIFHSVNVAKYHKEVQIKDCEIVEVILKEKGIVK